MASPETEAWSAGVHLVGRLSRGELDVVQGLRVAGLIQLGLLSVRTGIQTGMWDAAYQPSTVLDDDVYELVMGVKKKPHSA